MVFIDEKNENKDRKKSLIPFLNRKRHIDELKDQVNSDIKAIKDELEEHLDTINANTSEMEIIHDYLAEIDAKLNKVNERLDEIQMFTGMSDKPEFKHHEQITLTLREQEVFLVLYTATHYLAYADICRRLGLTEDMVRRYIKNMVSKGIPIIEKHSKDELSLALDPFFKDLQAKEKVVLLNQSILNAFSYQ